MEKLYEGIKMSFIQHTQVNMENYQDSKNRNKDFQAQIFPNTITKWIKCFTLLFKQDEKESMELPVKSTYMKMETFPKMK